MPDPDLPLDPTQMAQLQAALLDAFRDRAALRQLVQFGLDMNLERISTAGTLDDAVFEVLMWADARGGYLRRLLNAASATNPANPALRAFCIGLGLPLPAPLPAGSASALAAPPTTPTGAVFNGPVTIYGGVAGGNIGTIQTTPTAADSALSTQHSELARTNLPYRRNESFVGRVDEMAAVAAGLAAGRAVAVTGAGGLGKTQLAVELAVRAVEASSYPGGVWWVPMAEADAVAGAVAALGGPDSMAVPGWQEGQPEANRKLVQRAWAEPTARLLIFDNLEDPAQLDSWRPPATSGCRVLITSRAQGDWPDDAGVDEVPLEPLNGDAAATLLVSRRARAQHTTAAALLADPTVEAEATGVVAELGGLPLALALSAAYLKQYPGVTLAAYRAAIAREALAHPALNAGLHEALPTGHERSIAATFALSYDRLAPADPTDALALRLLHAAAACAPEPIPRPLLYRAGADDPAGDSLPPEQADPALARLSVLGLLDELPDTALRLDRLLAAYVQTRPLPGDDATARLEAALVAMFKADEDAGNIWAGRTNLPHLRHAVGNAARTDLTASALYNSLAGILCVQGDWVAARPLYERALNIREADLGPTDNNTATSLNNLAWLLYMQGDWAEARPLYERALKIREAILGPHHPDTAVSLNNLAMLLRAQGNYADARPLYERALAIRESVLGINHPDTAGSLYTLGSLREDMGDRVAARLLIERALKIREAVLGPHHPDTARSLNKLAWLLEEQGDYEEARPLYDRAVTIVTQALGPDHATTRIMRSNRDRLVQKMEAAGGPPPRP